MTGFIESSKEHLNSQFLKLKTNFLKGETLSISHRRFILQTLKDLIQSRETDLDEAIKKDLGLNSFFSYLTGSMNIIVEINLALKNLQNWTKPVKKETPLLLFPAQINEVNEPLGTVLIIGAWNYPLATSLLPFISAVAAGNCVILKPSEQAPHSAKIICEIINLLNQNFYIGIEGGIQTSVTLNKMAFDLIVFTGGTVTGKFIMKDASDNLCKLLLELGGKNPTIIDINANLDLAAKRIVNMKFMNCGQTCVTADLVFVSKSHKTEFINLLIKYIKQLFTVDAQNSVDYSKIISEFHAKRLMKFLDNQKDKIVFQAGVPDPANRFIPPTLVVDPSLDSLLMKEEIFGPILPIIEFDNIREVINYIKGIDKPLGIYYFGDESSQNFKDVKNETSSGALVSNDLGVNYLAFSGGFGGVGPSGVGKIRGLEGFKYCSNQKVVIERNRSSFLDLPFRYAPSSPEKLKKMKFIGEYMGACTIEDVYFYLKRVFGVLLFVLLISVLLKKGIVVINF